MPFDSNHQARVQCLEARLRLLTGYVSALHKARVNLVGYEDLGALGGLALPVLNLVGMPPVIRKGPGTIHDGQAIRCRPELREIGTSVSVGDDNTRQVKDIRAEAKTQIRSRWSRRL